MLLPSSSFRYDLEPDEIEQLTAALVEQLQQASADVLDVPVAYGGGRGEGSWYRRLHAVSAAAADAVPCQRAAAWWARGVAARPQIAHAVQHF